MTKITMSKPLPPDSFVEKMDVPEAAYRTAISIKHTGRMTEVNATFALREQQGESAIYVARCPRCGVGDITVTVKLNPDGSFAETPACPTLCISCEDGLDAMLEPGAAKPAAKPYDRAALSEHLKAMSERPWD